MIVLCQLDLYHKKAPPAGSRAGSEPPGVISGAGTRYVTNKASPVAFCPVGYCPVGSSRSRATDLMLLVEISMLQ